MYHQVEFQGTKLILKSNTPEEAITTFINEGPKRDLNGNEIFNIKPI